eukprot:3201492-Rhodomonas_salina.1
MLHFGCLLKNKLRYTDTLSRSLLHSTLAHCLRLPSRRGGHRVFADQYIASHFTLPNCLGLPLRRGGHRVLADQ